MVKLKEKYVVANKEVANVYKQISTEKEKYGTFHKCLFHLHTPASYDYRLLKKYTSESYHKECTTEEVYNLCVEYGLFTSDFPIDDFNTDELFGIFENTKECMTYLLLADTIRKNKIAIVLITDHNTLDGYKKLEKAIQIVMNNYPLGTFHPELNSLC